MLWTIREAFASRKPTNVAKRQRVRLAEIVAFARANSPLNCWLSSTKIPGMPVVTAVVERAPEPPEQSPGGKYRTVIPLKRDPNAN